MSNSLPATGPAKFLVGNVDSNDLCAPAPAELHRQVSQASHPEHRQALPGGDSRAFERAIDCNPGAKERRRFRRGNGIRNLQRVGGGRLYEFRIAAIHGNSGDLLPRAQVFVSFAAEFTRAAAPVNPRHSYTVTDF